MSVVTPFSRFHIGIIGKLLILCVIVGIIPLFALGLFSAQASLSALEKNTEKNLIATADFQKAQIERTLMSIVKDAIFLAELTYLKHYLQGERVLLPQVQNEFLEFNRSRPEYYQVRFIDQSGYEIIRSNYKNNSFFLTGAKELQPKGDRYYFLQGMSLSKGEVYFSPIDMNIEYGQIEIPRTLVLRAATPVYVGEEKKGLIIINLYAAEFFRWLKLPRQDYVSFLADDKGGILQLERNGVSEAAWREAGVNQEMVQRLTREALTSRQAEGISINSGAAIGTMAPIRSVSNFNHPTWMLFTLSPKTSLAQQTAPLTTMLLTGIVAELLLIALTVLYLGKRFRRNFQNITDMADQAAHGDFEYGAATAKGEEFVNFTYKFDQMRRQIKKRIGALEEDLESAHERIDQQKKELRKMESMLFRADKLASLGELSMRLAHEIGNPLASMKTVAQAICESPQDAPNSYKLGKILAEVDRLHDFLQKFNSFAIMKEVEAVPCDLRELVRDVNFFLTVQAKAKGVTIKEQFDPQVDKIMVDPQQIKQMLINLILNAIQASSEHGVILVSLRNKPGYCPRCFINETRICSNGDPQTDSNYIELCICDNGHGVPDEAMPKLFDPFFSTKQNGTGLGLSIASRIIDKHGGTIHVYSETGKGTAFKIYLPRYAQSQSHERQLADR